MCTLKGSKCGGTQFTSFIFILLVITATDGKFLLSEQGYAGFEIFLDIYFKGLPSNDPARKVR